MIKNRLARWVFGSTFVLTMLVPAIALAAETDAAGSSGPWQAVVGKAIAAGLAMGLSADRKSVV